MTERCTVCRLPAEKLEAINDGLRGQVPLSRLVETTGVSKSSLSRHSRHLDGRSPAPTYTPQQEPNALQRRPTETRPQASSGPSREELLRRIEHLWEESLDGLQAAKQPITVRCRDGSEMTVPGDLRSRVGFLREARGVVELQGLATGHIQKGENAGGAHVAIQIVCPAGAALPSVRADDGAVTIDIGSGGR